MAYKHEKVLIFTSHQGNLNLNYSTNHVSTSFIITLNLNDQKC